jgi:type IV pilus assembly protein PilY1
MKKSPRAVTVYTVDVNKVTTGQGPGWTALLKSMASVTSGKYFDVSSASAGSEIADALGRIFSEIQAVNSVFASVSLPTSVNTEGTYLNQVYIGMFRPDEDGFPRWPGNLKQYKLGIINNQLRTLDADNIQAINTSTGFITECARSFWTPTTAGHVLDVPAARRLYDRGHQLRQLQLSGWPDRREGRPGVCTP